MTTSAADTSRRTPADALADRLRELARVIESIDDRQYIQAPVGSIHGSIGGHVRHWLDHVTALVVGVSGGELDYDDRRRGTKVESERAAALVKIEQVVRALRSISACPLDQPIEMRTLLSADAPALRVRTTLGRELAFVLSHCIHHNAIIGAMVRTLGGRVPETFGLAPSTLLHQQRSAACAR